jgi:hypothetical protein
MNWSKAYQSRPSVPADNSVFVCAGTPDCSDERVYPFPEPPCAGETARTLLHAESSGGLLLVHLRLPAAVLLRSAIQSGKQQNLLFRCTESDAPKALFVSAATFDRDSSPFVKRTV